MAAVIDAEGLVLGRLCAHVAKRLLNGEEIIIVNAERSIISGRRAERLEFYKHRRTRGASQTKAKGPFYPRAADRILKRSVRGMLQYTKPRGRAAYRRLKVYIGTPKNLAGGKFETLESAKKPHLARYIYLDELAKEMGSA